MKMKRYTTIFLPSLLLCVGCLKNEPLKMEYEGFAPSVVQPGIELSTPEDENMNRALLESAYRLVYDDNRFITARSLLVYRNGKLVAEAYPSDPADIDCINNIQSATKSITSILLGIVRHDNLLDSLNEKLYNIYPEYFDSDDRKYSISIRDALTMQTGLAFDNSSQSLQLYNTQENSVRYVLSQAYLYPSGVITNYNDGAPQLIAKVIESKTGMKVAEYANEKLFSPLGITDWKWEEATDGVNFGAYSLFLKPRDLGKIGLLLLQHGTYNGETIIDSTYLAEATSIQTAMNFNDEPYGYYFWILPAYDGYMALGHGGQFVFISPSYQLVVVYTASPYISGSFFDQRNDLIALIVNSCDNE